MTKKTNLIVELETVCDECGDENSRNCMTCYGMGVLLTKDGRSLLEFLKRWLNVEDRDYHTL